jgi:hypothetical protein
MRQEDLETNNVLVAPEMDESCYVREGTTEFTSGSREGSKVSRQISSVLMSQFDTGTSMPRGSGSRVHRGSLAKFASGLTTRVLVRDHEEDAINTDVAILVDCSGSLDHGLYMRELHAAGAVSRAVHMLGGKSVVTSFGETVTTHKTLACNPRADYRFPNRQGNTNTGCGILESLKQLKKGSAKRKVIIVFTDGVPGYFTNERPAVRVKYTDELGRERSEHLGSPCLSAMKECYKQGVALIPIPFGYSIKAMKEDISEWEVCLRRHPRLHRSVAPFCHYMLDHGVFQTADGLDSCSAVVCQQISRFNGDLAPYIRG